MPLTFRSFGLALCLVALCALSALAGCGGGEPLTAEESAQHAADMAALKALQDPKKTIQPVPSDPCYISMRSSCPAPPGPAPTYAAPVPSFDGA